GVAGRRPRRAAAGCQRAVEFQRPGRGRARPGPRATARRIRRFQPRPCRRAWRRHRQVAVTAPGRGAGLLVALVLSTVVLQIVVAVLLKELAVAAPRSTLVLLGALALAVGLNGVRFLLWGYTHRHYPLSRS